jgi:mitochondrial import inner membrane translocase subunit TIM23
MLTRGSGLAFGGVWGLREGATRPLAVSNARLRINSILNSITRRGTFIGNSAGVLGAWHARLWTLFVSGLNGPILLALVYNGINSSIDLFRGKHDTLGSMGAGALTGLLYKSTGMYHYNRAAAVIFLTYISSSDSWS